ncbi:hypothetical protein NGM07_02470 [Halorussus vallis]|nr:hypothetical protein NGM07_02470 [Halorussus vallis]
MRSLRRHLPWRTPDDEPSVDESRPGEPPVAAVTVDELPIVEAPTTETPSDVRATAGRGR